MKRAKAAKFLASKSEMVPLHLTTLPQLGKHNYYSTRSKPSLSKGLFSVYIDLLSRPQTTKTLQLAAL
jgi:hypothetical protein